MKNICIPVQTEEKNEKLRMTIHLWDWSLLDTKFEAAFTWTYTWLQITIWEKKHLIQIQDIITQIVEEHEKEFNTVKK